MLRAAVTTCVVGGIIQNRSNPRFSHLHRQSFPIVYRVLHFSNCQEGNWNWNMSYTDDKSSSRPTKTRGKTSGERSKGTNGNQTCDSVPHPWSGRHTTRQAHNPAISIHSSRKSRQGMLRAGLNTLRTRFAEKDQGHTFTERKLASIGS